MLLENFKGHEVYLNTKPQSIWGSEAFVLTDRRGRWYKVLSDESTLQEVRAEARLLAKKWRISLLKEENPCSHEIEELEAEVAAGV